MLRNILTLFKFKEIINKPNNFIAFMAMTILVFLIPNTAFRIFIVCTFIFWATIKYVLYCKSLPPGPWGMPWLGYLPFMINKPPHKVYVEMSARYGRLCSVKLGSNLVVGIGCAKLMRELFNRPDSTGRPKTPLNSLLGGHGIIMSEGLLWKRQRRFLHEKFRALGVKLSPNEQFEKYIFTELEEMFLILNEANGNVVNPQKVFGRHVHNVICQLLMNFRFDRNDKDFNVYNEMVRRGMKLFGMVHMGEHFEPYLRLPGKQAIIKEIEKNLIEVSKFHAEHLKKRVKARNEAGVITEPNDLLDCYLDHNNKELICPGVKPDKQFIQIMNDLFSAGMDTTLSTLLWCFVMLLREPEAAKILRQELKTNVAPGQLITMEHRLSMPYMEAFIFETMRMSSVVPLGTIHVNETNWNVDGHNIPAGTHLIPLLNVINKNGEMYPEPDKFKPERFIVDGKCHAVNFMQFGVGQRMCLGNILARMELFLFLANIMNTFEIALPPGEPNPELEGSLGVIHTPLPFMLIFTKLE